MANNQRRALLILHFCVLIWGFTAILGNLISLQETVLVWYRMGITSLSLLLLPAFWKGIRLISLKNALQVAAIGILVALHWITFYGAIKYSNVSVALTCLATVSFFTALIEPIFFRQKHNARDLLFGLAVIPGLYMVFYFTGQYYTGMIMGIISALLAAVFSVLNKRITSKYNPLSITFLELFSGFIFIGALLPIYFYFFPEAQLLPNRADTGYLIILSLVCTTLPFTLSLISLRHVSAFTANLTINLEPVYGILLAILFFQEHEMLSPGFYIGSSLILAIVFLHSFLIRSNRKAEATK
jgi:drug/metabolite transporter (DMT)-like permease